MAATTTDPVLRWAAEARRAGARYGIKASVLLGLVDVESGGREGLTSSANAGGLTQFIPGTAKSYQVDIRPGHADSQLMGAAHYLSDLGAHTNLSGALASYNGGPGNPQAGYARQVLQRARKYTGIDGSSPTTPAAPDASPAAAPATQDTSSSSSTSSVVEPQQRSGAVKALVWIALLGAGVVLFGFGVTHAFGHRTSTA